MKKEQSYRMRVFPIETDAHTTEWAAEFPDLPGCVGAGDTAEEAVAMAMAAKKAWIETALEEGRKIPKPWNIDEYNFSGKFTLRLPKTLHKELTLQAEEEEVSLNQYLLYLITKGLKRENRAVKYESKNKIDFSSWYDIRQNLNWKAKEYLLVTPYKELLSQKS